MSPRFVSRGLLAAVLTSLPALIILVTWIIERHDLPGRLATHWSSENQVNDTSPTAGLFAMTLGVAVTVAALSIVTGVDPKDPAGARPGFLLGGVFSGGAAAVWTFSTGVALTTPAGQEPSVGAWPLLFFGCGYGLVPLLATLGAPHSLPHDQQAPTQLEPGQVQVWIRNVDSPLLAWIGLGIALVAGSTIWSSGAFRHPTAVAIFMSVVLMALVLFTFSLSRLQIIVDRRGFRVRSKITRLPVKSIALENIERAHAENLTSTNWGGWGYRLLPGRSAIILRSGEGIVIKRTNGRKFAITTPAPDEGVALLAGMVDSLGPKTT